MSALPTYEQRAAPRPAGRRGTIAAALACALLASALGSPAARAAGDVTFSSPQAAYDQGLGAVRAGKPELAVDAFAFAGTHNHVPALYYLGTIYANNDERLTDHAKAFNVFHDIVARYAYVDPVSDFRSVYVVRAAVRLADYYRSGVPALNLKPDPRAAVELLNHAATYFGDLEAQFQLAKMHLTGEGVEGNERYGLHWLSRLAHKNHAGAQAFLAELMWRGKFMTKDPDRALVWSTLSVEGAGEQDRLWIEEVHQTIYCGAPAGVRERAGQLVADWRRRAPATTGAAPDPIDRAVAPRGTQTAQSPQGPPAAPVPAVPTARTCPNGEAVPVVVPGASSLPAPGDRSEAGGNAAPLPAPLPVIDKNALIDKNAGRGANNAGQVPAGPAGGAQGGGGLSSAFTAGAVPASRDASTPSVTAPAAFGQGFQEFGSSARSRR